MKSFVTAGFLCFAVLFACSIASAQEREFPAYGISASFDGSNFISFPVWLKQTLTLTPAVWFQHLDRSHQEIYFELGMRYNFREYPAFPFIGLFAQVNVERYRNYDREVGYSGGLRAGGEYFLNRHFSLAAQFSITSRYRPDICYGYDPDYITPSSTRVTTYSQILGAFYF